MSIWFRSSYLYGGLKWRIKMGECRIANPKVQQHIMKLQQEIRALEKKPDRTKDEDEKLAELRRRLARSRMRNNCC